MLKPEVRIIAWDDCAFRFAQKRVLVLGTIFRGGSFLDGLLSVSVNKDGNDGTDKIASSILSSRHYDQLSYIMLDGITVAGFNVVDIRELNRKTRLPVIAVQRKKPDMKEFMKALQNLDSYKQRIAKVKNAGKFYSCGDIIFQKYGLSIGESKELLKLTCTRSNIPEPLRVAHLIASGLSGESRGRA